jgi:hypothetical protein
MDDFKYRKYTEEQYIKFGGICFIIGMFVGFGAGTLIMF